MFTIDFTKPFLYKDIIYFNQGNLAANNILRCKLATGGDETLEGCIAAVTFKTLSNPEINESVNIVDVKNCIVDIKFPSNALEVGVNELEIILTKGEGIDKVVTPSPIIKYEVWQCITTGNGIQGDSNYPILIDLISDVNNVVVIANDASDKANESLKKANKMITDTNSVIEKANVAIDNTNNAKDEALNAVEEVNSTKDNLISEVNAAKKAMIEDVNSSKESMINDISTTKQSVIADTNKAIEKMNNDFEALTASQQQDAEVILARDGEESLNARLERDLAKGKMHWETVEGSHISIDDTLDSYMQNIEIKGNTIQNPNNLADIKSVGDRVEEQELYRIPIVCCSKNLFDSKTVSINKSINDKGEEVVASDANTSDFIKVESGSHLVTSQIAWGRLSFYDKDKKFLFNAKGSSLNNLSSNTGNAKYVRLTYNISSLDVQLEYGTQATQYEPYQEHKLNILSPTPLEKVGDVEDRIIEKDGVLGVEKNINTKSPMDNTIAFVDSLSNETTQYAETRFIDCGFTDIAIKPNGVLICNKLKGKTSNEVYGKGNTDKGISMTDTRFNIRLFRSEVSDNASLREYLKTLKIKYQTNKPQFIPLPHAQQVKLKTFANKTNISFLTEIEGTIKADVAKSISASVNSNTQEISDLWDFVLKSNLANFAVALNTLDTKLRLEQLTKTLR